MDKAQILQAFRTKLELRVAEADHELSLLDEAAAGETKSSAGDKYETAREMIAQARSMQSRLRSEAHRGLDWLARQDLSLSREAIGPGCLVSTSSGTYLVGILTESVQTADGPVQGITMASPLGQALRGKRPGEVLPWRQGSLTVLAVI